MKIYTKTGDKGKTSLAGGQRVEKTHIRLEAYGTIDELNSFVGLLLEHVSEKQDIDILTNIQSQLFAVGCLLATSPQKEAPESCRLNVESIIELEDEIDRIDALLPPLNSFIMPGGGMSGSLAHVCRTIARRAERRIYDVAEQWPVDSNVLVFINRLSDYFFILARKEGLLHRKDEKKWDSACR